MFTRITEHIYIFPCDGHTDRPNIGVIIGNQYTLLWEAGNSGAHVALIRDALKQQGLPAPNAVAISHWHWDHSYGAAFFTVPIIAGRKTDENLRKMMNWKWDDQSMQQRIEDGEEILFCTEMIKREYPDRSQIKVVTADVVFDGELSLDLGDVTCRLIHATGPHASDSVVCHIPEDRFLFLGDSNCKDLYGLPWEFDIEHEENFGPVTAALSYDREKVNAYLDILDTLDFDCCISGHWKAVKTREELYQSLKE